MKEQIGEKKRDGEKVERREKGEERRGENGRCEKSEENVENERE